MIQKSPPKLCPCCKSPIPVDPGLTVNIEYNTASRNGLMVGLEPQSAVVLSVIEKAWPGTALYSRLEFAMYGNVEHLGDFQEVLRVRISRMRKLLKPLKIGIANTYCLGYRLELL